MRFVNVLVSINIYRNDFIQNKVGRKIVKQYINLSLSLSPLSFSNTQGLPLTFVSLFRYSAVR